MPLNHLKRKLTKGNLWLYLLALLKQEPVHAYGLRGMIEKNYGFRIGNVTAYMVLYKLEKKKYVTTSWRIMNGRHRKYYAITKKGKDILDEGIGFLRETVRKLN